MKASIKKSPSPKFYALAQLGEDKWDITGLVRRNLSVGLETQENTNLSSSVLMINLSKQAHGSKGQIRVA